MPSWDPSPAPPNPLAYVATVTGDRVQFVFPPVGRDSFEWWTPAQRQQLTSYSWMVLVRGPADTAKKVTMITQGCCLTSG